MKKQNPKRRWLHLPMALFAGGMMMLGAPIARATVYYYWTGATPSGDWSVGANWVGGVAPNGGDERIIFPQNVVRKNATNDLPAGTLFESIWITGVNYEIHGNAVRIPNLTMEVEFFGGTSIFGSEIRASGDLTIQVNSANTHLIVSGDIILSGDILTVASGSGSAGDVTISGAISGNGSLYKRNIGGLTLSGFSPNTFSGPTVVAEGRLWLRKATLFPPGGVTSVPDDLDIGTLFSVTTPSVALEQDDQIANNAAVDIFYGELLLNDHDDAIGSLTTDGGSVGTGTGLLTLNGRVTAPAGGAFSGGGDSTISGRLSLGSNTRRFDVASNVTLRVSAAISIAVGALDAGLIKMGEGALRLSGANSYFGHTTIEGGTLTVANDNALGIGSSGTTLENGRLILSSSAIANQSLVVEPDLNTLTCSGNSSWSGNIVLNGTTFFNAGTGDVFRVSGAISGPGDLRKTGAGILRLAGAAPNTFEGNAQVNGGTLELQKPGGVIAIPNRLIVGLGGTPDSEVVRLLSSHQIADDALVSLSSSGLLDLNNFSDAVRAVTNSGHVALGSGTLTVSNETAAHTFSGTISGTGDFIKHGSAQLTLPGANTYSGQTYIRGGTVLVNGPLASSLVQVQRGTLGGTGTVQSVTVFGPGTVSPGNPLGILRVEGDLLFLDGAFHVEINGTVVESGYDRLRVGGNVTIGSAALSVAMGFQPPFNTNFTILNKVSPGAISGTFAGLPEGGHIGAGGFAFQITYLGGDGNNVALSRSPAPASRITSIRNETTSATIRGAGLAGIIYTLQGAADLTSPIPWTDLGSDTGDASGLYQFIDVDAPNYPNRFYRVRSP